jgi:serine/threonine protein kinase
MKWRPEKYHSKDRVQGEICGAILHSTPIPPSQINPHISAKVESLVNKTLEKDLSLRYQHAADIAADLRRLKRDLETGERSPIIPQGLAKEQKCTVGYSAGCMPPDRSLVRGKRRGLADTAIG